MLDLSRGAPMKWELNIGLLWTHPVAMRAKSFLQVASRQHNDANPGKAVCKATVLIFNEKGRRMRGESMRHTRIVVVFIALAIPFTALAQKSLRPQANSRTLEGVVVDTTGGPQWIGIVVESNGRRYVVSISNSRYPASDPKVTGRGIESIGTRVKVTYTKTEPWINDTVALVATRIIKLDDQTTTQRGSKEPSVAQGGDWNSFWNTFRAVARRRDKVALKRMMTVEFNTLAGISYSDPDARDAVLQDINWNELNKVLMKNVGPLQNARGKTIRQAPPILKDVGMVAIFEKGNDGRWRWSDFYFYH
jgi:hypothetical protein